MKYLLPFLFCTASFAGEDLNEQRAEGILARRGGEVTLKEFYNRDDIKDNIKAETAAKKIGRSAATKKWLDDNPQFMIRGTIRYDRRASPLSLTLKYIHYYGVNEISTLVKSTPKLKPAASPNPELVVLVEQVANFEIVIRESKVILNKEDHNKLIRERDKLAERVKALR